MSDIINQVIFRDKNSFENFIEKHIGDNGEIDLCSFFDMPDCIKDTYLYTIRDNLNAAAYFILEELDIDMRGVTEEEIKKYIDDNGFKRNSEKYVEHDIANFSSNYQSVLETMENNNFNYDSFYNYGKSAFKVLVEHDGVFRNQYIRNRVGVPQEPTKTTVDRKNMQISWVSITNWCSNAVQRCGTEAYFRATRMDGYGPAIEMWTTEKANKSAAKTYATLSDFYRYSIVFQLVGLLDYSWDVEKGEVTKDHTDIYIPPNTKMLDSFLKGVSFEDFSC